MLLHRSSAPGPVLTWPLPFLRSPLPIPAGRDTDVCRGQATKVTGSAGAGALGEALTQLGSASRRSCWSKKARLGSYRKLEAALIEGETSNGAMAWGTQGGVRRAC